MLIDFRSDTVTRPTEGMRDAMARAPLGDDVFGEDPSVNALEAKAAALFGMEAGLFCPSGTMTNQIAIRAHTRPGDEVICDGDSHIYVYEGGGIASNSGASVALITGDRGRITAAQVRAAIQPDDVHRPISRLVSLENTSNRGGGSCYDFQEIMKIRQVCDEAGLALHLDGARLFNALIAKGDTPEQYGKAFHSISICLSKGLGAPIGSLLLGTRSFIKQARRIRKAFGGGMRQAGMLAAAGAYALDHHVQRLGDDHRNATAIAGVLAKKGFVAQVLPVETNIVIAELSPSMKPTDLVARFKEKDILIFAISPTRIRIVTHLDINGAMVDTTTKTIDSL